MKKLSHLFLFCLLILPFTVHAQSVLPEQNLTLKLSPLTPEPNTETTISLDAYSYETNGATIIWYVDGKEETSARNQRSLKITTKDAGEETNIKVDIDLPNNQQLTKSITINPIRIDLVLESNTLVPAFYQGRSLPTVGSTVRVIATPYTGGNVSPSDYTYVWKHNNQVLFGGAIKGKQVAEIKIGLGIEQIISVDVINSRGETVAKKSIVLPLAKPEILFYEENPLRGASQIALSDTYYLIDDEVTLRAEPYYMDSNIFSTEPLIEWSLNSKQIPNPSSDPQYLTLQKKLTSGAAKLSFHIRNLKQLLQGVEKGFVINF